MSMMPLARLVVSIDNEVVKATGFFGLPAHDAAVHDDRRRAPATLVVVDRRDQQLRIRRNRRWSRGLARLLSAGLDRQLAAGRSPESSPRLAARAQVLVSPAMRRGLALDLTNLIEQANRPIVMRNPRAQINRLGILACEPQIRATTAALLTSAPAAARGVAALTVLLSDGTGPFYNRRRASELSDALTAVQTRLDPASARLFAA